MSQNLTLYLNMLNKLLYIFIHVNIITIKIADGAKLRTQI